MHRYLQPAHEIHLERGRGKDQKSLATEAELSKMRGLNGKLQWATRNGMPQGVGDASMLAQRPSLGVLTVGDITEANAGGNGQAKKTLRLGAIGGPLKLLKTIGAVNSVGD